MSEHPSQSRARLRSRQNPQVRDARRLARDVKEARRAGVLLADGIHLVRGAIASRLPHRALFLDTDDPDTAAIQEACTARRIAFFPAARSVIQAISTLATPQGAVGLFERPSHDLHTMLGAAGDDGPPFLAILHGLQDPTNAGSLVRTALAAGLSGVIATEGTVDPFHSRAVRASMGACFRLPIATEADAESLWSLLKRNGYTTLALDPRGATPLEAARREGALAVVLGREGTGIDAAARRSCDLSVRIPMASGVESLGVAAAGAIVFYALARPERGA